MKKIKLIVAILSIGISTQAQNFEVKWKFKTEDKVLAPPALDESTVYIGSEDGFFYAIDQVSGKEKWRYQTRGRIQAEATVHENLVIFESGNNFYALDRATGQEQWKHEQSSALWGYKIDPYDDKRSKGIIHEGIYYVGSSLGGVIGLNLKTGKREFVARSQYGHAVRTTPMIKDNRLFFGDWAGKVYAYSLEQEKQMWMTSTYEKKLYDTFGGIASEIVSYNGHLYFGARNHNLQVLEDIGGQQAWSYADSTGGWIIGDPVIENDVMYIGGSDNLKMFAFDAKSGKLIWDFKAGLNIYTKPILTEEHVIFTSGNTYNHKAPGGLFLLDKKTGELVSKFDIPEACFSSPKIYDNTIYFGAYDGYIYAVKMK